MREPGRSWTRAALLVLGAAAGGCLGLSLIGAAIWLLIAMGIWIWGF